MSTAQTVGLFGGLLLFNLAACLPVLLSSSVRRLFDRLPADRLAVNYLLSVAGFTVLQSALLIAVVVLSGDLEGVTAFWSLGAVTIGTALLVWISASFVFPRKGYWSPEEEGDELDGRIALGLGFIWYTVSTGTGLFFLMVVLITLFFPG